jgi:benzoate membrane transport protein
MMRFEWTQPVLAGLVAAIVGFASTFAIVLAGLRSVGASSGQAASGLLALCLGIGAIAIGFSVRLRMPITIAWSTPGAALLVSTGEIPGGYPAAIGAFILCGTLVAIAGIVPMLSRAVAMIPVPIAAAMLAGVLLPLCTAPVKALLDVPALAAPIVLTWVVLARFAPRWAVPGALVAAVVAIVVDGPTGNPASSLAPSLQWTTPTLTLPAVMSVALPLFLVTMAAQNVPGMAVLSTYGYQPRLGPLLVGTGAASMVTAPFGGHAVNLAAITAALAAGPDAHPDTTRRWIASVTNGITQAALGLGAGLATALVLLSPPVLVEAVAGLALLGALTAALRSAVGEAGGREAAVVTFVVTASGASLLHIGPAFWGLLAGILIHLLVSKHRSPTELSTSGRR